MLLTILSPNQHMYIYTIWTCMYNAYSAANITMLTKEINMMYAGVSHSSHLNLLNKISINLYSAKNYIKYNILPLFQLE